MIAQASIQVDLDSFWTLEEFWGLSRTHRNKSLYSIALPRFLALFKEYGISATFFVVGRDVRDPEHVQLLKEAIADGHEIANHSMHHRFHFSSLHDSEQEEEILQADRLISQQLGIRAVGFRAPGYSINGNVIRILAQHQYTYDASLFPSFFNPLMSWLHRWRTRPHRGPRSDFGGWRMLLAPSTPYYPDQTRVWRPGPPGGIVELPLAVTPILRLPFYANANLRTGLHFFQASLGLFRQRPLCYLFHLIELAGPEEIGPALWRHPNAQLSLERKLGLCRAFLEAFVQRFRLLPAKDLAHAWRSGTSGFNTSPP